MRRTFGGLSLLFAAAFFAVACVNRHKPTFVEKCAFEMTDNADGTWNVKKTRGDSSCTIKATLTANSLVLDGFLAGTLLVAGGTGFSVPTQISRSEFRINCTYRFYKGSAIQIQKEGKVSENLNFFQNGKVVTDFTVTDATGKTIAANQRTMEIRDGKVQSVSFKDSTQPQELPSRAGKRVDLRTMQFDEE